MGVIDGLKRMFGGGLPEHYVAPEGVPAPDRPRKLVLYKFDACPWCRKVQKVIEEHQIEIDYQDTRKDTDARATLRDLTGKTQVPCLFVDDTPFFESRDIKRWLLAYVAEGHHRTAKK